MIHSNVETPYIHNNVNQMFQKWKLARWHPVQKTYSRSQFSGNPSIYVIYMGNSMLFRIYTSIVSSYWKASWPTIRGTNSNQTVPISSFFKSVCVSSEPSVAHIRTTYRPFFQSKKLFQQIVLWLKYEINILVLDRFGSFCHKLYH